MAMLEIERLCAWYGRAQILHEVSFAIESGEVAVLLGRNGAGKSTTMRAIMRLVPRIEGRVRFCGEDISGLATHEVARRGIAYVPEDRRIFTDLTVEQNLEVGRLPARADAPAWTPAELFKLFPNLGTMRERLGGAMSGGEQQMLTIARALMGNPRFVLLDDPSEGLAPVIVEGIAEAIRALAKRGVAMLISEQNLHFARLVCDRAFVIERGELRYQGSIRELDATPKLCDEYLSV